MPIGKIIALASEPCCTNKPGPRRVCCLSGVLFSMICFIFDKPCNTMMISTQRFRFHWLHCRCVCANHIFCNSVVCPLQTIKNLPIGEVFCYHVLLNYCASLSKSTARGATSFSAVFGAAVNKLVKGAAIPLSVLVSVIPTSPKSRPIKGDKAC